MSRDNKEIQRKILFECSHCNKFRIAGQAFTSYKCNLCELIDQHPNTAVPLICLPCAKKYGLCRRCQQVMD